ncbi:MAG: hypothetical protein K2X86_09060 [Cytophagaceae bacterium]|nr:hypothetical protein [Cytophagaceae bacterium]
MNKNQKEIRIICLAVGGFYVFFSLYTLFLNSYIASFFSNLPGSERNPTVMMMQNFQTLYDNYMPYLAIIGIAILLFGLLYLKIKAFAIPLFVVLSAGTIAWALYYSFGANDSFRAFEGLFNYNDVPQMAFMKDWINVAYLISIFTTLGFFVAPQIILGVKVWKDRKPEVLAEA